MCQRYSSSRDTSFLMSRGCKQNSASPIQERFSLFAALLLYKSINRGRPGVTRTTCRQPSMHGSTSDRRSSSGAPDKVPIQTWISTVVMSLCFRNTFPAPSRITITRSNHGTWILKAANQDFVRSNHCMESAYIDCPKRFKDSTQ